MAKLLQNNRHVLRERSGRVLDSRPRGSGFNLTGTTVLCTAMSKGPCIHLIEPNHRIGPEIGLFLCLTDSFFFTRMMCIKDFVFSAICMHLNILILI